MDLCARWLGVLILSAAAPSCSGEGGSSHDAGRAPAVDGAVVTHDPDASSEPLVIEVGSGETVFEPLADGDVVELEYGIQGGYHMWAAARILEATPGGITLTLELEDRNGPIFRQRHRRHTLEIPADTVGMRALIDPDRVDTASVTVVITATDETGRTGEDRCVVQVHADR